ncbi:carboxymuconolactone decarboxylase family protein [Megalodesulfovibrio paquesii]
MLNNWQEFLKEAAGAIGALDQANPKIMKGLGTIESAAGSKGALDGKTRELIALAVAVTTRCDTCIAVHAAKAVELGASRDELAETLAMATALNAGAALVYSSRALDAFDQFSKK